ncbi:MAG: GGDEF domain-containing protein [Burkholderiaceae bacterium]
MPPISLRAAMRLRLRTAGVLAADYAFNLLMLCGFAVAGLLSYHTLLILFGIAASFNAIFLSLILSGKTRRFRDSSATSLQLLAACGFNLLGLVLAPQIAYFFMINLFVPLSYGSMHFTQRMFIAAWLMLACAIGAALNMPGAQEGFAAAAESNRILFWAVTVFALGRFLAINAEVSRLRARLLRKNNDLALAAARLTDLASRDELTGLWNRREFMRLLLEESRRAVRSQSSFCVAVIDIDHFKKVNDTYGHLIGDAVLHELAQLLESMRRATDSVARYGGEEFTLLLVNAKITTATVALERIRVQVMQHDWDVIAPGLQLTVSAGIAAWHPGETLTQVLNRADAALYKAKHAGRNCVRVSQLTAVMPA